MRGLGTRPDDAGSAASHGDTLKLIHRRQTMPLDTRVEASTRVWCSGDPGEGRNVTTEPNVLPR